MNEAVVVPGEDGELERIARGIGIPPIPRILIDLAEEIRRDDADFGRIEKIISNDVALSAALIKAANSPLFAPSRRVVALKQAATLLGMKRIDHMARSFVLQRIFSEGPAADRIAALWEEASLMGAIMTQLARRIRTIDPDEAYAYGLFHDCGIALLMQRFPDYVDLLDEVGEGNQVALDVLERGRYPVDHAGLGYVVAKTWLLPEILCQAIRSHHDIKALLPDAPLLPAGQNLVAAGLLAENILARWQGKDSGHWAESSDQALAHLFLEKEDFEEICNDLQERLASSS